VKILIIAQVARFGPACCIPSRQEDREMTRVGIALTVGLVAIAGANAWAGMPDDKDIVIRGCVTDANAPSVIAPSTLVWSRSDIMLAAAEARNTAVPLRERIFYWLDDDEGDDLKKHRGQRVEIEGELEDFEKGTIKVDRKDDYTKVKLDLDGKTEEAKVPSAWLNEWTDKDREFEIVGRRIDVKKVKVLGSCGAGSE
jgi:hypothetical protein